VDVAEKIGQLKKERNALILAHPFQIGETQDIADFVGSKEEINRFAVKSDADVIVVCGVTFMAEMVSILCHDKTVLLPDMDARCPMTAMMPSNQVKYIKEKYQNAAVVSYVKSTANVKAKCDYCCPSEGSIDFINGIENDEIVFATDRYMGLYIASNTEKKIILGEAYCPPRTRIIPENVMDLKEKHPDARVLVSPQCRPEIIKMADEVFDTKGMYEYIEGSNAGTEEGAGEFREFIIGNEVGLVYRLEKDFPGKRFYPASEVALCHNHKLNDLTKIYWALKNMKHKVEVPEDVAIKARKTIENGCIL